ncbi:hypothetical protein THAOC_00259, partial [Thalassiosira oceanica]
FAGGQRARTCQIKPKNPIRLLLDSACGGKGAVGWIWGRPERPGSGERALSAAIERELLIADIFDLSWGRIVQTISPTDSIRHQNETKTIYYGDGGPCAFSDPFADGRDPRRLVPRGRVVPVVRPLPRPPGEGVRAGGGVDRLVRASPRRADRPAAGLPRLRRPEGRPLAAGLLPPDLLLGHRGDLGGLDVLPLEPERPDSGLGSAADDRRVRFDLLLHARRILHLPRPRTDHAAAIAGRRRLLGGALEPDRRPPPLPPRAVRPPDRHVGHGLARRARARRGGAAGSRPAAVRTGEGVRGPRLPDIRAIGKGGIGAFAEAYPSRICRDGPGDDDMTDVRRGAFHALDLHSSKFLVQRLTIGLSDELP